MLVSYILHYIIIYIYFFIFSMKSTERLEGILRKPRGLISVLGQPVSPNSNINPNTNKKYPDRRGRKQGPAYGQIHITHY
jgi:hypothetical protein